MFSVLMKRKQVQMNKKVNEMEVVSLFGNIDAMLFKLEEKIQ